MKIIKFIIAFQFVIVQSALSMQPDWELQSKIARDKYILLANAVMNQDYEKTMTLLFKAKINPNPPHSDMVEALCYAKSKPLAQLLIANGARIPSTILSDERCLQDEYQADLLALYLEKGFKPINIRTSNPMEVLLHALSKFPLGKGDRQNETKPESNECLKNRLEKAQLLLKFGANPYLSSYRSHGGTAFHLAASKEDIYMCRLLIEYEIIRKPAFVTFLAYCKHNFPRFYAQKDILRVLWNNLAPSRILALKDRNGAMVSELGSNLFKLALNWGISSPFNLESALACLEELEQATRKTHE